MRHILFLLLGLTVLGCKPAARTSATNRAAGSPTTDPELQFESASTALSALTEAYTNNNGREVREIETWLRRHKDQAVEELSRTAKNEDSPFEKRLVACRGLARLGTDSVPTLMELTNHATDQLRYRAAESLAMISPSSQRSVEALRQLLQRDDARLRGYAVRGLGNAGELAQSAVPELVAILNDLTQNDGLRNDAKAALKKIDPRKGLMGLNEP